MKYVTTKNLFLALAASTLMLSGGDVLADQDKTAFEMSAVENAAAGETILDGDYAGAAREIRLKSRTIGDGYSKATNLCVSFVLEGKLESAEKPCERAVGYSRLSAGMASSINDNHDKARQFRAVALSNRGVLRGISGDLDGAQEDFERAARLNSEFTAAVRNLAHLDTLRERLSAVR